MAAVIPTDEGKGEEEYTRRKNIPHNPEGKKFTEAYPPPPKDQLPADMQDYDKPIPSELTDDDFDMLNRPMSATPIGTDNVQLSNTVQQQEVKPPEVKAEEPKTEEEKLNKMEIEGMMKMKMSQTQAVVFWSQVDEYDIEMEDGSIEQYRRVGVSHREYIELSHMAIEVLTGRDWNTDEVLTPKQSEQKQEYWLEKQALYYLRNVKTGKPMSKEELMNCKYSFQIQHILASCQWRSKQGGPEGKK